ncbi:MAG: EAL domain-containing response regulator [Burkholderiales bacterium]|nr:EAL domain-containing response regulator [Burkholderiales bacterium]
MPAPPERTEVTAAPPRIAIVDDDAFQREVMRQLLFNLGHDAVEDWPSGAFALQRLAQIDSARMLLIIDLEMPGMDGVELMRGLAQRRYAGAIALISVVGGRVLESAVRLAREHGFNVVGHARKPASLPMLRAVVQAWSESATAAPQRPRRSYGVAELRRALVQDELILEYQPQVALSDGRFAAVEALVRWQHPFDGVVGPGDFVEDIEAHGLIDELTDRVLALALAQAACWREQVGLTPRIAVNMSMDNLYRLDFPDRLRAALAAHRLGPATLLLELTESRLMSHRAASMDILTRLRLHHVQLAIDDFGTGHSSLAQLRDLPFDELKIDRSFVHGSTHSTTQRAIVAASIEMAHLLGMRTVAEGVEDEADWLAVRAAGCDVAQGWFIARPMSGAALPAWCAEREQWLRDADPYVVDFDEFAGSSGSTPQGVPIH